MLTKTNICSVQNYLRAVVLKLGSAVLLGSARQLGTAKHLQKNQHDAPEEKNFV